MEETPFIGLQDIEAYEWKTHTMTLTRDCQSRIKMLFGCGDRNPMISHRFALRVEGEPVYPGKRLWRGETNASADEFRADHREYFDDPEVNSSSSRSTLSWLKRTAFKGRR